MFVRTDAKMWQAIAGTFEPNSGTFERRTTLRSCQGIELARRRAMGVRRCANVLE
jgi:hypothetical protein